MSRCVILALALTAGAAPPAHADGVPKPSTLTYPEVVFSPATQSFESTLPYATPFFIEVGLKPDESKGLIVVWTNESPKWLADGLQCGTSNTGNGKAKAEAELCAALKARDCAAARKALKGAGCAMADRAYQRDEKSEAWRVRVDGHPVGEEGLEFREDYTFLVDYGQRKPSKAELEAHTKRVLSTIDKAVEKATTDAMASKPDFVAIATQLTTALNSVPKRPDDLEHPKLDPKTDYRTQYVSVIGNVLQAHAKAERKANPTNFDQIVTRLYALPGFAAVPYPQTPLLGGYDRAALLRAFGDWGTLDQKTRRSILNGTLDAQPDPKAGLVWKPLRDGYVRPLALCHFVALLKADPRSEVQAVVADLTMKASDCSAIPSQADTVWSYHTQAWATRREAAEIRESLGKALAGRTTVNSVPIVEQVKPRAIALDNPDTVMLTADIGVGGIGFSGRGDQGDGTFLAPMVGVSINFAAEDKRLPVNIFTGRHTDLKRCTSVVFGVTTARLRGDGRAVRGLFADEITPYLGLGLRLWTSFRLSAGLVAAETQAGAPLDDRWSPTVGGFIRASFDLDVYRLVKQAIGEL